MDPELAKVFIRDPQEREKICYMEYAGKPWPGEITEIARFFDLQRIYDSKIPENKGLDKIYRMGVHGEEAIKLFNQMRERGFWGTNPRILLEILSQYCSS
jgi:hypothetical protein